MRYLVTCLLFGLCCAFAQSSVLEEKIFIFQKQEDANNKTLLVVTWSYEGDEEQALECEMFTDPQLIEEVIKASKDELIRTPSEQEMQDIVEECTEISRRRRREALPFHRVLSWRRNRNSRKVDPERGRDQNKSSNEKSGESSSEESGESGEVLGTIPPETGTEGYNGLPVIFPGTKWCGAGDLAKNFDDLGIHQDTDRCCRAHDLCNDTLAPGETKNNLTNKSSFTKLSCTCDNDFYDCLENVNSLTSNTVGNMYFNILKRDCYEEDYPLTKKCKKYKTFLKLICVEYERNKKVPKEMQWVPARRYKKIPIPIIDVELPF